MPIPTSRQGESVPLVTSPPPTTGLPCAGDPGPGEPERGELLGRAAGPRRGHRFGTDEAGGLLAAPAEARLDRARDPRRGRCRRGGSRPPGAGCRARRAPPARPPGARARPTAARRRRAPPGSPRRPRRCSPVPPTSAGAPPRTRSPQVEPGGQRARLRAPARCRAPAGPARRASRSPRAGRAPSTSRPVAWRLEPGEVLVVVGRVGDGQIAIGLEPVGEEVVEHAAVLAAQHAVLRAPDADRETSLLSRRCSRPSASGPLVSISPMCETSKTPARSAHGDVLGSRVPAYSTGISQPAKATILAPASRCRSNSGVLRRV